MTIPREQLAGVIEAILPEVSRPARYIGGEWNAVVKDPSEVAVRVAWTFPDAYEVGMSHLGSQILYGIINRRPDALCERAYTPWMDMEARMRERGIPLFTLESWTPVAEFDIMAFPLLYELTYSNVLTMLDLAGIPLESSERTPEHPLVLAGGPCAFNPEPLAPFLDCVVLGDGEGVIHAILDVVKEWRAAGRPDREQLLGRLATIPGCYVPSFYAPQYGADGRYLGTRPVRPGVPERIERATIADLDQVDYPTRPLVPNTGIVFDRAQVEVFRGCTRGCRFCHAGMVTRPVRERSPEVVQGLAREMVANTGYDELSLVSLSTADYTDIEGTLRRLVPSLTCAGVNLTLPSTRVDAFSVGLAEQTQQVRKSSLTLAPEGGSARIRRVINKTVSDLDIREALRAAFRAGYRSIKLYFIIGLPTETDADLAAIPEIGRWALEIAEEELGRREARRVKVVLNTSVFVPKPHTPFQWEPQVEPEEVRRRQQTIRRLIRDRRIEFRYHESGSSQLEALLSLGDRRVAATIRRAWELGARFDGWGEHFDLERWLQACRETGVDLAWYVHRRRDYGEPLPWDHLFAGVTREFLVEDHRRALSEQEVEDCRWENCTVCGACMAFDVLPTLRPWRGEAPSPQSGAEGSLQPPEPGGSRS